jgi:hypothetical protein
MIGAFGFVIISFDEPDDIEFPLELDAATVNVYIVFDINPDTVIGDDVPVPIKPSGLLVTIYPVIVPFPPVGGVKYTFTALVLDTIAVPIVGAPGFVITDSDGIDETDVPPVLDAATVNVYIVFTVNPDTVIGEDVPVPVAPELLVTVYPIIVPVPFGMVNATLIAVVLNILVSTIIGGLDIVVTVFDISDDIDVPPEFIAVTVNV